ncbi:MAG: Hsp70 family protein [Alphaproteobacteria bacterium]|nr:Hsp70 family protein [Alphaproteobacteria bacterium]
MHIGIDLGTSNSVIAGVEDGKARIFHPADGGEVLPSAIYVDKRGHRLYGRRAHDQGLISPENVAAGFKRLMGSSTPIEIKGAGLTLSPEECSAEIIRQLIGQAITETGREDFIGTVITVPASFNQMQAEATLRAAKLAGLERVDLLQEPVAAAMASMANAERSGQFLIYDLGGGTFDVALAQAINGEVNIVTHQGINMLGGRDFDRMIVNEIVRPWLIANFDLPENFQRDKNYQRLIRVAQLAAEKAKIDLSVQDETSIFASDDDVRLTDQSDTEIFIEIPFARSRFEEMIRTPVIQTIDMIRNLLSENNYSHDDIDRIVFIGGPSRIPLIRQMVSDELGIAADINADPMTVVATGAAYYCESRQWNNDNVSSPKPKKASSSPVPEAPELVFDYSQRTPEDKTIITVHTPKDSNDTHQLRVSAEGWDSGVLPLTEGLTIMVPLNKMGENLFNVRILNGNGAPIAHEQTLSISRVIASTVSIPAAQTIAVKVLEQAGSQKNILMPLVNKGTVLPTTGQVQFTSARDLSPGTGGSISFELFQVEYPERIELNLCVGLFRVGSEDIPQNCSIKAGDPIVFNWRMSDSGILQAGVQLPNGPSDMAELKAPRFYAPQAGQISFADESGQKFAQAVLQQGEEEWGDLTAAIGPEGGSEVQLLKARLDEQREILGESADDPETVRRMVDETRFVRQDIARLCKKYRAAVLQRKLGKMSAVFNRVARANATKEEKEKFDKYADRVQQIIDESEETEYGSADVYLDGMRDQFFAIAWRDPNYVATWYKRLENESYLFPDATEFNDMVAEGKKMSASGNMEGLRDLVSRMLAARVAIGASDSASELATIVKV